MRKRHMQPFSKSPYELKCKELQIFILLRCSFLVSAACCTTQQISSHTVSVWWNYCMTVTLLHSSSVNKPRKTVWHLFNAYHLTVTLLAARPLCAADISYCSTCFEIPQCVLTSPCTDEPPLTPQWHHTSMWCGPRRKAVLRICRTQRGVKWFVHCLSQGLAGLVFDISDATGSVVLIICGSDWCKALKANTDRDCWWMTK